jgi:hypothetical protein
MTRATLKTLWVAGGGLVATWLAVAPNQGVQPITPAAPRQAAQSSASPTAGELNEQASKLIERTKVIALRPSERNPFRFASPHVRSAPATPASSALPSVAVPVEPPPPILSLAGIAEEMTSEGPRRTAIVSGSDDVYLVHEGDSLAGRFIVKSIEADTVLLQDASGAELRIVLR